MINGSTIIHRDGTTNKINQIEQKKHGYSLSLDPDGTGSVNKITTSFTRPGADGKIPPNRVYEKRGDAWFQTQRPNGAPDLRMQGDLKVEDSSGLFTQILRRDMDGDGNAQETTRTMNAEGTEIVNRMDKSYSIFGYDKDGHMNQWTEGPPEGGFSIEFTSRVEADGRIGWVSNADANDVRYEPKIGDNGNVTYKTKQDLEKPGQNQVVTSTGDHIFNGENGVKYDFNSRGDVSSIQFPKPRLFEGHVVSRIDIGYRDPINNQGQIIDRLSLYAANGSSVGVLDRVKLKEDTDGIARDAWNVFSDPANGQFRKYGYTTGDFAIKNGLISTTDPLPMKEGKVDDKKLEEMSKNHPEYFDIIKAYKNKHGNLPPVLVRTYKNEVTADPDGKGIIKSNENEQEVKAFEQRLGLIPDSKLADYKFDILVAGEDLWKSEVPVPVPPTPGPSSDKSRSKRA